MLITITAQDIGTVQDHGSVALITGTNEDGTRITFGLEPRMLDDIARATVFDEEEDVTVEVEGWQIMGSQG